MKKYDEGYALVLVLVVLIVVCLVAVSILTVSVNNLNAQRAAMNRMQEKYEAQGKIEEAMAVLEEKLSAFTDGFSKAYLEDAFDEAKVECTDPVVNTAEGVATFRLSTKGGIYRITCDIAIEATFEQTNESGLYGFSELRGVEYTSYKIELVEDTGGDS